MPIWNMDFRKYVEYEGTQRELYDLGADPYELTNSYDATNPPAELVSRLKALETCKGVGCVVAENGQEQDTGADFCSPRPYQSLFEQCH
jgi:hypothetical protein